MPGGAGGNWTFSVECAGGDVTLAVDGLLLLTVRAAGHTAGSSASPSVPLAPGSHLWELAFVPALGGPAEPALSVRVRWSHGGAQFEDIPAGAFTRLPSLGGLAALDPEGGGGIDATRAGRIIAAVRGQAGAVAALEARAGGVAEGARIPGLHAAWWRRSVWSWAPLPPAPPTDAALATHRYARIGRRGGRLCCCCGRVPATVDSLSLGAAVAWPLAPVFVARFSGYITVPHTGRWTLYRQTAGPGCTTRVTIDGVVVPDNAPEEGDGGRGGRGGPGGGGTDEVSCTLVLDAGTHALRVDLAQGEGERQLVVSWSGPGTQRCKIPGAALSQNTDESRLRSALYIDAIGVCWDAAPRWGCACAV